MPTRSPAGRTTATVRVLLLSGGLALAGLSAAPASGAPDTAEAITSGATAYVQRANATSGSVRVRPSGGSPVTLTELGSNVIEVEWAPDGSRLAAIDADGVVTSIKPDGDDPVILGVESSPAGLSWSPDGATVAYSASFEGRRALHLASADGLTAWVADVVAEPVLGTSFGSDGTTVVVTSTKDASGTEVGMLGAIDLSTNAYAFTEIVPDAGIPGSGDYALTDAEVSPDGAQVAYVLEIAGQSGLWVMDADGSNAVEIVADSADTFPGGPSWTPDGAGIVYSRKGAGAATTVFRISPAGGSPTTLFSGTATMASPVVQLRGLDTVKWRLGGTDRMHTAITVSEDTFAADGADAVVLARSDLFPDALAGVPLAAKKNGPLLITPPKALDARVATEIQRVLTPGAPVYVLGSTSAISTAVTNRLDDLGFVVHRLFGADRFGTALAIADEIEPTGGLLLATGRNFPDALSAGPAAASLDAAVILVDQFAQNAPVKNWINAWRTAPANVSAGVDDFVFAIGNPAWTAVDLWNLDIPPENLVSGASRYETSRAVAEYFFFPPGEVGLAVGDNFPDALSGGAQMAWLGQPLLITQPTVLTESIREYFSVNSASVDWIDVYGSATGAVREPVADAAVAETN